MESIDRFVWNGSLGGNDFFGGGYERHSGGGGFDRNALCGIDRFVELIRSERFAWRIDRLAESVIWWKRSIGGINWLVELIGADSYSFSLFGSVACMYSC